MKYNYGDAVRVQPTAPSEFHPNEEGWVVAISPVSGRKFCLPDNETIACQVEFNDGSAIEIPEQFLEPYTEIDKEG